MKLKKLILSAQSPMADPGLSQYSNLMGKMASFMSWKSCVRCFLSFLASWCSKLLSMLGKIFCLMRGQSWLEMMRERELPMRRVNNRELNIIYRLQSEQSSCPTHTLHNFHFTILSVTMNTLLTQIQFGIKKFQNFRKRLVLDYKKGGKHDHTNPHAIPLKLKQKLINSKKGGDWKKIRELERQSLTPYGRFAKHGFIFQKDKLPVYDIPNIDGFELRPYVEFLAPKLSSQLLIHQQTVNDKKIQEFKEAKQVLKLESKTRSAQ